MATSNFIEFLVMRHGQSVADLEDRFEGWLDCALTAKGLAQASGAADWIAAQRHPDCIFASTLQRARQTVEIISARLGGAINVVYDDILKERNNGILAGMKKLEAKRDIIPADGFGPDESVKGGETLNEFRKRAEGAWEKLLDESRPGQRILVVSHGGMIDMLFNCFLGLPFDQYVGLRTGDTGMHCWRVGRTERKILFANRQAS